MNAAVLEGLRIQGTGLITGMTSTVEIAQGPEGSGIQFILEPDQVVIPADLTRVVHTDRGVTLADPATGRTLSIVEHFLSACALAGVCDLKVTLLAGSPPELPLLDGSAWEWYQALKANFSTPGPRQTVTVVDEHAVAHRHTEDVYIYAIPAPHLQVTYCLNYTEHPDVNHRWVRWDLKEDGVESLAQARTWGFVAELPALQAQGIAKGVSVENTLGLTEDGGYTSPLRMVDEPVFHKIVDLLGDLYLTGINPLGIQAHIFAVNAGHGGHVAFAKKLKQYAQDHRLHADGSME